MMPASQDQGRLDRFLASDPFLLPYKEEVARRLERTRRTTRQLAGDRALADFALGHQYFGMHREDDAWVLREWAPSATAIYLIGAFSQWRPQQHLAFKRINDLDGIWEIRLPASHLRHGDLYRLSMHWADGCGDRIPAWARRVVQDPQTMIFNAQVWQPEVPFRWRRPVFRAPRQSPLIYEVHIGMAQEEARIGTYAEFAERILPRIVAAGYNTIQIMAVQEHPYYASFGYHVSSFFAPSSRFGTPDELKALIDQAHVLGLTVLMDLVHSHAVNNEIEGISRYDGSHDQFFHQGSRGRHTAWDSRCFDYAKPQVLHFLLSNCRYWLDEFRVDGFRFDGITSMLYLDHGLAKAFTSYDDYFNDQVDEDALTYLGLANQVIHDLRPDAITIAEDVSGMPGLARPREEGGTGFDFRFAMGIPDHWIKLTKDTRDEAWHMGGLWFELNNRRHDEKTISYTESHDQALVGDQTLIFRLIGGDMYHHMAKARANLKVERGVALHKMIRLITLSTAGHGYLTFMGNEFGHPEWIDFPREGNNWSYHYARRQWHLIRDPNLHYRALDHFDRDMIALVRRFDLLSSANIQQMWEHNDDKVLIFRRAEMIFVFNFHPTRSFSDYQFPSPPGQYRIVLNSDDRRYDGHGRVDNEIPHFALPATHPQHPPHRLSLYLPHRTALVLASAEKIQDVKWIA